MNSADTIYALATPVGGAIAVIRLSGKCAIEYASQLFSGTLKNRYMAYGRIIDKSDGRIIDDVMASVFEAPHSYTGENMAEIYAHGSRRTVSDIMELLSRFGARSAQPGEFTQRAFLNGKMDLSEAEAVMDLINSSARRSAQSALMQMSGALSKRLNDAEALLMDALCALDAAVDYPDEMEEDIEPILAEKLQSAEKIVSGLIERGMGAARLRDGVRAVIAGRPNAGKSSLMNRLLGEERAIVTSIAGTTRDTITESVTIDGIPFLLTDTAGLREASDEAEAIGVERAKNMMDTADMLILVFDGVKNLDTDDILMLKQTEGKNRIAVVTKNDTASLLDTAMLMRYHIENISISSLTGDGVDSLKKLMVERSGVPIGEGEIITNSRHIDALGAAYKSIRSALNTVELDAVATDIRDALHALGAVSGKDVDADVIDEIFSRFCVGK